MLKGKLTSRCECEHCRAFINIPVNWFTMYFYEDLTLCWIFLHMKIHHGFQETEDNWFTFVLRFIVMMLKFDLACVLIPVKIILTPFVFLDEFLFFNARRDVDFEELEKTSDEFEDDEENENDRGSN